LGARFQTFGVWASALVRWAEVIAPLSTMASSTSRVRCAEASGLSAGL
jgi:hypothetical protein